MEIGTEELPAAYLEQAFDQLKSAQQVFDDAHIHRGEIDIFVTPRRLAVIVHGVERIQRNQAEEIRGPSKQASFDATGQPTIALKGFLNSRGGTLSQVKVVGTEKGEYMCLVKPEQRVPTVKVLPQLIEQLVTRLRLPKTMRWDNSGLRFARPIRWLVALYGTTPVRVSLGRLTSGRTTFVGGPKQPKPVRVSSPVQYLMMLRKAGIELDQRARRNHIETLVRQHAAAYGGVPAGEMITHDLLDEVNGLVERPVPVVGMFDPKYLELPPEVLLASMAKHQRVFAVESKDGKLLPRFIGILDGMPKKPATVAQFMQHILNARLADSFLFWRQDQDRPLSEVSISTVTFHERLGSMADKVDRMRKLAGALGRMWHLTSEEQQYLDRACLLAKSDLVSAMVKEFPTLQGVMGKYYASESGEDQVVADAIEEQYLPIRARLPETLIGSALAILEKYDTLVQYFAIGIKPTGNQDPFGLRRAAQGIVEVVGHARGRDWWYLDPPPRSLNFTPLHQVCTSNGWHPTIDLGAVCEQVKSYLLERVATPEIQYIIQPTPSADVITAVLSVPGDDLVDVMSRIEELNRTQKQDLLKAAKVVERTHNITKSASITQADPDQARFQEPLERKLWDVYSAKKDRLLQLIEDRSYAHVTKEYGEAFFDPLNEFFAQVMVNVPDQAIQQNRLALMRAINALYTERVADLSRVSSLSPGASSAS